MDAIMLRVFPVTLTGATKRHGKGIMTSYANVMVTISTNTRRYAFYNGLEIPTRRMLDSHRPIPGMTAARALVAIQETADHSQNWHDEGSLGRKETIERYLEESSKRQDSFEEWMKRFRESTDRNLKMHDSMIKGVEKKVEQLAQVVHSSMIHHSKFVNHVKMKTFERNETLKSAPKIVSFSNKVKKRIGEEQERTFLDVLKNELPPKEKRLRKFHSSLCLGDPKPIRILIEMANKSIESPKGIIENVLVKIDKFIFPVDFVILDIVEDDKDLGDFLDVNDLLPENDGDPFGVLSDSESEMGISLDVFSGNLEDILIEQASQFRQNEENMSIVAKKQGNGRIKGEKAQGEFSKKKLRRS
ncbi:hypothetical protein Tco_0194062 [Tanacetum coccineum]